MEPITYLALLIASLLPFARSDSPATTCARSDLLALTFDDGPYVYQNNISDYLYHLQIKGTFFVNGNNYGCIYDDDNVRRLRKTFEQGHLIASHTWSHPNISTLSTIQINEQLELTERALIKILGVKPKFVRFPYGEHNERSLEIAKNRGYTVVDWSFDSQDSIGASAEQSIAAYEELAKSAAYEELAKSAASQIALNHETQRSTAYQVIPQAVPVLQKAGYKLVHVSECLGMGFEMQQIYQWVGSPSDRDESWTCDGTPAPGS